MRNIILLSLIFISSTFASPIKKVIDEEQLEIDVPNGSFLKVLTIGTTSTFQPVPLFFKEDGKVFQGDWSAEKTVYGPLKVIIKPIDSTGQYAEILVIYEIRKTGSSLSPLGTAVVPNDANGEFDVLLEKSNDLKVWDSALPGEFGSSSEPTFFRVKILKK